MGDEGSHTAPFESSSQENMSSSFRNPSERPIFKLSVRLIDTYKHINRVYYEARARRSREAIDANRRGGVYNDGYDDQQYDYIIINEEIFYDRYILKHRIGKGSFGQVVCAYDQQTGSEVAIKIIKSRRPFTVQAQTEIALLELIDQSDRPGEYNIVKMINKFVFRNHQCLVFEMLSYNLYELLKNTKFKGVSLNLIRKFSRQILKSLAFLARPDVDIIHCDLKPENILLRHPRRSAIKLIDFGSSCHADKRMYTYIQSRFYRSPEVLLGLTYDQKIDIWSLGCVLVEMHTGEPLFGGSDQCDQMCRIVDILGMPPLHMIESGPDDNRNNYFERVAIKNKGPNAGPPGTGTGPTPFGGSTGGHPSPASAVQVDPLRDITLATVPAHCDSSCVRQCSTGDAVWVLKRPQKEGGSTQPPKRSLAEIIGVYTGGPHGRHEGSDGHGVDHYMAFLEFIQGLLLFDPKERRSAELSIGHTYIVEDPNQPPAQQQPSAAESATSAGEGGQVSESRKTNNDGKEQRGREQVEWRPRVRSRSAPSSNTKSSSSSSRVSTTISATNRQQAGRLQENQFGQPSPAKQPKIDAQNLFADDDSKEADGPALSGAHTGATSTTNNAISGIAGTNGVAAGAEEGTESNVDDATTTESRAMDTSDGT